MIKTVEMLTDELSSYSNIPNKIASFVKANKLFPLKRGIYELNPNTDPILLASAIYSPSYISFETALSYHGLIPEKVTTITSATFNKRKKKIYTNYFATYTYEDIPSAIFYKGVNTYIVEGYILNIATKEKALLDKLYKTPYMNNILDLLENDLRIDIDLINNFDFELIKAIYKDYNSRNVTNFYKYLGKINE